jgi:hypothetical protein
MTPKEKAEQLVHRIMYKIQWSKVKYHTLMEAKDCALIAVDEMLEEIKDSADKEIVVLRIIYWEKVKQEIDKL